MAAWIAGGRIIRHQEGALMSLFTDEEIAYLQSQRLGRLATASMHGELHITPVGFAYNAELDTIDIGGGPEGFGARRKNPDAHATGRPAPAVGDVKPRPGRGVRRRPDRTPREAR